MTVSRHGRWLPVLALLALTGAHHPAVLAQAGNCAGLPVISGQLPAGTYTLSESCVISGTLTVSGTVVINGNGNVITGSGLRRIFAVAHTGNLTLNDARLVRGSVGALESGGAISSAGVLSINDSVLSDNQAGQGGGAVSSIGTLSVMNSVFVGNESSGTSAFESGGGAIYSAGPASIAGATFVANRAVLAGGAITSFGPMTVSDSQFLDHVAMRGGAIDAIGQLSIASSLFDGNTASGGGALIVTAPVTVDITSTVFRANAASDSGGAIAAAEASVVVASSNFIGNRADLYGGAIALGAADLVVTDSAFVQNSGALGNSEGGAIADLVASTTTVEVARSRFEANRAALGGALHLRNAATLDDIVLSGNVGDVQGGAMQIQSTAAVTRAMFEGNVSTIGGGIHVQSANGVLDVKQSVFRNNRATTGNGGAILMNDGNSTITNTTFTGNLALVGTGSAVFARDMTSPSGTVALLHVTVSGNPGVALAQGNGMVLSLRNSIVSGNGSNCGGLLADLGGNLVRTSAGGACTGFVPASTADPLLSPLAEGVFPLQSGSPAIDAAPNCAGLASDQRGVARPQGAACDIGAFEAAPPLPEIFLDGFEPVTPR